MKQDEVPAEYLCPITRDIMEEPVTIVQTGNVYDRQAIEEWFSRGKNTCPLTGEILSDRKFIPNRPLRDGIERWCNSNPVAVKTMRELRRQATLATTPRPEPVLEYGGCWAWLFPRKKKKMKTQDSSARSVSRLSSSVREGCVQQVRELLANGVPINALDEAGRSPLHWAATDGNAVMVEELINNGADVNLQARDSATSLHFAAQMNHMVVARILVSKDADVNKRTKNGYTPLHKAAYYGNRDMCMFLLKCGSDRHARNIQNQRPLEVATTSPIPGAKDLANIFRV